MHVCAGNGSAGRGFQRRFDEVAVRAATSGCRSGRTISITSITYRVQILGEREVAYLTEMLRQKTARPNLRHRHPGTTGLVLADSQVARKLCCRCASGRRFRFSPRRNRRHLLSTCCGRTCQSILPIAHLYAWCLHGHPWAGRAHYGRVRPGQSGTWGWNRFRAATAWWPTMPWTCTASANHH